MKTRKTLYKVKENEVLDIESGELCRMETEKHFTITRDSEPFYMIFIDHIAPFFNIKSDTAKSILTYLCTIAAFNTGKVDISSGTRAEICSKLNISTNTFSNNLKILKDNNLLVGQMGLYTINPQIFWKGDSRMRRTLLKTKEINIAFKIEPVNE